MLYFEVMFIFETKTENWTCNQVFDGRCPQNFYKCSLLLQHVLLAGPLIIRYFCSFCREMAKGVRLKMLAFASPANILLSIKYLLSLCVKPGLNNDDSWWQLMTFGGK